MKRLRRTGRGPWLLRIRSGRTYSPPAPANFRCWKHSLQNTGRPCVGRNGTVVSFPHAEHVAVVSTRSRIPGDAARAARLALHALHRFGSFLKFLSAKKSCSPAVQMNSVPQSTQLSDLSWNSIGPYLSRTHSTSLGRPARETARSPSDRTASPDSSLSDYSTSRRCFLRVRF